jgi:hypothetical protein
MADVYAVFGSLLALGIAFPGMLTAWWLLFPRLVARASHCLDRSPWTCLGVGIGVALVVGFLAGILAAVPLGFFKFIGLLLTALALGLASVGAAGVAALLANRLAERSEGRLAPFAGFLRGALALELAAAFPLIGWLLTIPLVTLASLGAAARALLSPRGAAHAAAVPMAAESAA